MALGVSCIIIADFGQKFWKDTATELHFLIEIAGLGARQQESNLSDGLSEASQAKKKETR